MTLDDSVHAFRLRLMARAQALHNVSQACREFGISRSLFYRWRKRYLAYGPDGLHPGRTSARPGRPPLLSVQAERAILALAIAWPTWGPLQLALQLRLPEHGGWQMAPSTVYRLLRRSGLQTRWERLAVLEAHSAQAAGLLTERTRRQLLAAQRRQAPHVKASQPGELVCLDTFYIGKLKGVGKVWQYTACDAACSFGIAQVSLDFSAAATAHFLTSRVLPAFHKAGWELHRVLTDQGNEFRGRFDQACVERGIRHTRTRPRHAWTNGFVERLHGTILQELWRIEFRRRFFTSVTQLQAALDRYLDFYNHRRAHQGYRTQGRTPGQIFLPRSIRERHTNQA
ncbi:MAG: IS481 family transposase [Anaerolineales bacterium]